MISRRAVLALGPALWLARPGEAAPVDILGWRAARRGMSHDQVAAAIGGDLVPVKAKLDYDRLDAADIVPRVDLAGRPFAALFQYEPVPGRLRQILLIHRGSQPIPADFVAVLAALTAELGPPAAAADKSGLHPSFSVEREWRFPSTRIHLRYTDPDATPFSGVRKELITRYSDARAASP